MTPRPGAVILLGAIAAELAATTALKASDGFSRPLPTFAALAGYALAFYALSRALRTIPLGVAYAIWSGVGIVAITLIGRIVFGQALGLTALAGIALIVAGVLVLDVGSAAG